MDSGVKVVVEEGTVLSEDVFVDNTVVAETFTERVREDALANVVGGTVVTEAGALLSKGHTGIGGGIGNAEHVSTFLHGGSAGRFEGTGKQGDPLVSLVTCVISEITE